MKGNKEQLKISPRKEFKKNFAIINSCILKQTFVGTYNEFQKEDTNNNDKYPKEGCIYLIFCEEKEIILQLKNNYDLQQKSIIKKRKSKLNNNSNNNGILYIGKSLSNKRIKSRLSNHFQTSNNGTWGLKLGINSKNKQAVKVKIYTIESKVKEKDTRSKENALAYFELCMHDLYRPLFGKK